VSDTSESEARAAETRALLIAAADDAIAVDALTRLRQRTPGVHVTAITRVGASIPAESSIAVPALGPFGFALRPGLIRRVRRGFDVAIAVVGSLDSSAYRRTAALLSLARAREKVAVGPGGERISLSQWLARAEMSVSPLAMLRASLSALTEPYRLARVRRQLHRPSPPWGFRRVNIGISDRCNHRCIMCSEHSPHCADGGRRMAAADVLDEGDFGLMDASMYHRLIHDLVLMGTREVELCGLGEPLVHPRIFDFLKEAKQAGLWTRLVTNASLLNGDRARELVAMGLDELHVSINGGSAETYARVHGAAPSTFARVISAVRAVSEERSRVGVRKPTIEASFVIQALNFEEPVQWVQEMAQAGVDIVTFSALGAAPEGAPVRLTAEQLEAAKENVRSAEKWAKGHGLRSRGTFGALAEAGTSFTAGLYAHQPCYIGYIFALVTASGRVHPCCACERVVGDLKQNDFAEAWRRNDYRQFREEALDLPNRLPALGGCSCMSCPYGPWNAEFHARLHGRQVGGRSE